ncbi:MAG TPA: LCP family protein [Streptosporangiaceae bacterium]|jgi:LCP family protein required for cell wall assembly
MRSAGTPPPLWGFAGKAGYAVSCIAAVATMVISGFSYSIVRGIESIGTSHAIISGPSIGAQNILVMGLESRTDWNGNILPNNVLAALHSGSRQQVENGTGGNDTNTLILLHIFAGGQKAVGFSIPRDDWVNFAGMVGPQEQGKIDQAYGVSMYYQEGKLRQQQSSLSRNQVAFGGNEAGRSAAVATVEKLTGVHIDHFAEVNMDGFYELARVFGGVQVCLKHAVRDANSGADFHAGYQHLDARQALAFVRQRDGLPNGDLDRTHRQQAFLDSVMHQLKTEGVLSDLSRIQSLLSAAKQYVITDQGWNLLDFATQMRSLTSGGLVFHTLPIKGYQVIGNQDANVVDPTYIKKIVAAAFNPPPGPAHHRATTHKPSAPAPGTTTVDVLNGGYTAGLAGRVSAALTSAGYKAGQVGDTAARTSTEVRYGAGASANASKIASMFGVQAGASPSVAAGHVEIMLGSSAAMPDISPSSSPSTQPTSIIPTTGAQGGAVRSKDGIPCVN